MRNAKSASSAPIDQEYRRRCSALLLAAPALAAPETVPFVRSGGAGSDEMLSRIEFL